MDETNGPEADPMDALVSALQEDAQYDEPDEPEEQDDEPVAEAEESNEPEAEEAEESDEEEKPAGRYKVTVQDENGALVEQAVSFDELKAGYQRAKDVEAVKAQTQAQVSKVHQEAIAYVTDVQRNSQKTLAELDTLVRQALEVVSPEDMLSLAQSDPSAYHQAMARQNVLQSVLGRIKTTQEQTAKQASEAEQQKAYQRLESSRKELAKAGITTAQVNKLYESAGKVYGYSPQELAANLDHRLVLLLKDAAAYKTLEAKKPQVQNKVREAPKPPPARSKLAQSETQKLVKRLSTRGATRDDLAALLSRE